MDSAAKNIATDTAATADCALGDELVAEIIEREKYIELHPDEWIDAEESIRQLRERNAKI